MYLLHRGSITRTGRPTFGPVGRHETGHEVASGRVISKMKCEAATPPMVSLFPEPSPLPIADTACSIGALGDWNEWNPSPPWLCSLSRSAQMGRGYDGASISADSTFSAFSAQ